MYKFVHVLQSILIFTTAIAVLTVWVLGTIITIQIDRIDRERSHENLNFEDAQINILHKVDDYCRRMERRKLLDEDVRRIMPTNQTEKILQDEDQFKTQALRQHLIYIKDLKQMWCLVPKAASTSWSKALIDNLNQKLSRKLNHENHTRPHIPLQSLLRDAYKVSNSTLQDYNAALSSDSVKKVLLVRHPFARIVSAYEDKLKNRKARPDSMYFFRNFGVKINRQYRSQVERKRIKKKEPTFEEFIEYLLHTDVEKYDEHWQPISSLCGVCQVKYDYIIRQEDLDESFSFYLHQLGFPSSYLMPHQNRMGIKEIASYYQNVSRRKVIQLFQKYKDDFIFNYTLFDYYIAGY